MPVRRPIRENLMFFNSYGTRTGPVRDPQGCRTTPLRTRTGIDTTGICKKKSVRAPYLIVRAPYGPRMGCSGAVYELHPGNSPYGARQCDVMPQSHHTPVRDVPGLFSTKIVRPLTGPARGPCGAVRILPPRTGPVEF